MTCSAYQAGKRKRFAESSLERQRITRQSIFIVDRQYLLANFHNSR